MTALEELNEKDFELFGHDDLETDDIFGLGDGSGPHQNNNNNNNAMMHMSNASLPPVLLHQPLHPAPVVSNDVSISFNASCSSSIASTQSQQRKRRAENVGVGSTGFDKAHKMRLEKGGAANSDALPSYVSVTSSTANSNGPNKKHASNNKGSAQKTLADGTQLIPDFFAVLGDKQSGGRGRTTTATSLLRDVKEWYKEQKPIYRDQGRLNALIEDALQRYFSSVAETFPHDFPATLEERKKTILIYCSKEALQSGRVAKPNCFTYEAGKPAKFGLAAVPEAISFFLDSRDAPSLPSIVAKLRRDFENLRSQEGAAPKAMISHFEGLLQFCEMQLQAAASQEMAQKLLDKLNLIPALKEQWKFLKEHAAANGKTVSGGRSVASFKSRNSQQEPNEETKASFHASMPNLSVSRKEQGKKIAKNRKSAAQRMKARQPHDYRSFNNSANFNQGPFLTMQPQADDDSECGSNWSSSYYSQTGHPSGYGAGGGGGAGGRQQSVDDESLTDNCDDDDASFGLHRSMQEINFRQNFHDNASAASAVSSVTAATATMRMEEDEGSSTSNNYLRNTSNNSRGYHGGCEQDGSWNQRALSRLRLQNDGRYGGNTTEGNSMGFSMGVASSNDSVTSASSRSRNGNNSSRRARAIRQQRLRGSHQMVNHQAMNMSFPGAVAQPLPDVYQVTAISVVDPHGDDGMYTGNISNQSGMPHGLGRFEFLKGGRWYEGNWVHGHWTGKGRLSNGDGSHYEGGFQDDLKHGEGKMVWGDGRVFDGVYQHGQMHWGKMQFSDGGIYNGYFLEGLQHGRGTMVFADSSNYDGDFERGNFHGRGKMVWNDGGFYEGEWQNGMIHGTGKEVRADGSLRHEGNWSNGAPVR